MKSVGDVGAGHVLGRYELLLPIATGGMAMVWAARLKGTRGFQKIVAVKTMLPSMSEDADFEQMFLDEAALASRIRHPHVVEIMDLGEENGVLYLVMEWIDGEPLNVLLRASAKKGGIPFPVAVRIAMQACAGLHAAHELRDDQGQLFGLVHRDMTPQNVLVTYDGVVKVVDFGVAKATGRGVETTAGQVKGKVRYMAPEQARGNAIDRRTDVFALGILLYLLTTGQHPFKADTDAATLFRILNDDPPDPPSTLMPNYPAALETVVMQALAKDPAKRFPTANDLLRALDQSLPKSMRTATDDEVAAFMGSFLGDRKDKRRAALQEALKAADDRAAGRVVAPPTGSSPEISTSGMTPLFGALEPSGSTGSVTRVEGSGARTPNGSPVADGGTGTGTNAGVVAHSGPGARNIAIFAALGGVVVTLGLVALFKGKPADVEPRTAATASASATSTATLTASAPVPATPPPAASSATPAASAAPTTTTTATSRSTPTKAQPVAPPPPPKTTTPGTGPKIRDPGF